MAALLSLRQVCAGYGRTAVLSDFNLDMASGELVFLRGPNGAGKSTVLKLILGLLKPRSGDIQVLHTRLWPKRPGYSLALDRLRQRIAYVPQFHTLPELPVSVAEFVMLGRWGSSFSWLRPAGSRDRRATAAALDQLGIGHLASRQLRTLSGGQRQKAGLSRALVRQPELLLMDEPATWLDEASRIDLAQTIVKVRQLSALGMLIVTHQDIPGAGAARSVFLDGGRLYE
ncbi:MAG: metal ABC transporter ATP-binding protein [Spirochaetes bacterium]|nr:metal ABC transporter ATP-binding protein [Spirochaetota bacterium]MBU0955251.1 metal ABC transporter ATP-binding protein [Spirochaetota bacterium]